MSSLEFTAYTNISFSFLWSDFQNDGTILRDLGTLACTQDLANGSGNDQADQIWHVTKTLASGGTDAYDLSSLSFQVFNETFPISFSGGQVRQFYVHNLNDVVGADITISCTGVTDFNTPFNNMPFEATIPPKSMFCFPPNFYEGWAVTSGNFSFRIEDTGGLGSSYEIAVIGTSGVI